MESGSPGRRALCGIVLSLAAVPLLAQEPEEPGRSGPVPPASQTAQRSPLTRKERLKFHLQGSAGYKTLAGSALGAGIAQWRDDPHEWGQGMAGYGRRFASKASRNGLEQIIQLGVGAALAQDPRYFRAGRGSFTSRTGHAVKWTFVTTGSRGETTCSTFRLAAAYGAAAVSRSWYPGPRDTWRHILERGSTSIAFDAVYNIAEEFWPDIRKRLRRRKPGS